jgi:dTDP-4-amino-4,6-dideoxygalactose transaminase
MKFLGWAYNYTFRQAMRHLTIRGRESDRTALVEFLNREYEGKSYLYYNGRSALAVALNTLLGPKVRGAKIGVNAYTCYAVVQAVQDVGAKVVYLDIELDTYNFSAATLARAAKQQKLSAVIVQNTLGVTLPITEVEKVAKRENIKIIEDLAHCVGLSYKDGRKVGTVGDATFLSFGRGKPVDTEHGAALVLRGIYAAAKVYTPTKLARRSARRRDRLYPILGWKIRKTYRTVGRGFAWFCLRTGLMQKSAEGKVEPHITLANWQARLALEQLQGGRGRLSKRGQTPSGPRMTRLPLLVKNRKLVLKALAARGYYFDAIWWDIAVSPERYFARVGFDATKTPVAFAVGEQMINIPTNLNAREKQEVISIIREVSRGA